MPQEQDRMDDYEVGPGCYPKDDMAKFAVQLGAALVAALGLALRDGWRAATRNPHATT